MKALDVLGEKPFAAKIGLKRLAPHDCHVVDCDSSIKLEDLEEV